MIQHTEDLTAEQHSNDDATISPKYDFSALDNPMREPENRSSDSFNCNICFDSASDPVVTLCGHLYCWECIFKWLHVQSSSDPVRQQACPVCKAGISQASLIPLYCHGPSHTESNLKNPSSEFIPPRPSVRGLHIPQYPNQRSPLSDPFHQPQSPAFHHHQYLPATPYSSNYYTTISSSNLVSTTIAGIINPTIGFLGELVYTRMFGSSNASLFTYPLPSSYAIVDHNNSRMRRQELKLYRVSIFLVCCVILCLFCF